MTEKILDKRIFRLVNSISDELGQDWKVAEISLGFGLSIPHFQKLFKREVGMPPMTWLHDRRLEKFAGLLLSTFHPIKQLAYRVGLKNESHLTRDFKKKYGLTPTGYRKHHAKIEQLEAHLLKAESKIGQK